MRTVYIVAVVWYYIGSDREIATPCVGTSVIRRGSLGRVEASRLVGPQPAADGEGFVPRGGEARDKQTSVNARDHGKDGAWTAAHIGTQILCSG